MNLRAWKSDTGWKGVFVHDTSLPKGVSAFFAPRNNRADVIKLRIKDQQGQLSAHKRASLYGDMHTEAQKYGYVFSSMWNATSHPKH